MQRPSKHKMALLTMLGAYPTIVLLLAILRPLMGNAPMPLQAAVLVTLMVGILTYFVMPLLSYLFSGWLRQKRTRHGFQSTIAVVLILGTTSLLFAHTTDTVADSADASRKSRSSALEGMTVDHVMINVSDFEKSVQWYEEMLGFRESVRWTVEGLKDTKLAYLKRGSFLIEIASGPKTKNSAALPKATDFESHFAQRGITHLCFNVRDVDAALTQLRINGVPTFSPAIDFPALNCRVGFVQDPDGNVIEFKGPLAGNNVVRGEANWKKSKIDDANGER